MDEWAPVGFIVEEIQARFDHAPTLTKKPGAPSEFIWRDEVFKVDKVHSSWVDYGRRGRMARNMKTAHLEAAERRGSWGVGRYYFRVQVEGGRVFDLYYDRAPKSAADRSGHWFIWRELVRGGSARKEQ
jgi:hypothetical protein